MCGDVRGCFLNPSYKKILVILECRFSLFLRRLELQEMIVFPNEITHNRVKSLGNSRLRPVERIL